MKRAWLEARGGTGPAEIAAGISQVLSFLQAHGSSRFEEWRGSHCGQDGTIDGRTPNRLGWRRMTEDGWEYFVTPSGFRELARGFDHRLLARALVDRKLLVPDNSGKSARVVSVPDHGRMRLYYFPAGALETGEE